MNSYIVFDPSIIVVRESASQTATVGSAAAGLVAKPGDPEILYSHIIAITRDGTVELEVSRILPDGTVAVPPGFREERDEQKALAEAATGKLVLRLGTPW